MPSLLHPLLLTLTALSLSTPTTAVCATTTTTSTTSLTVTPLHTFAYPSWLENLAIRSNGEILTTRMDTPILYQVNHLTGFPVEVATWNSSQYAGALGISETTDDVFYVILAAFTDQATFTKTSGVNAIFKVDMQPFALDSNGSITDNAIITHVTDIPSADFLNGMATLDDTHVYVSDVYSGVIYLVDVAAPGSYRVAVNDTLASFGADAPTNLGSNGLKVRAGYLYWTNTARGFLARVPVGSDGLPTGASAVVATGLERPDDFQFRDDDGTVFVAQNQWDTLSVAAGVAEAGLLGAAPATAVAIAGSNVSTVLAGVTSPKFGRTSADSNRLYMSTSGGLALPINGTVTVAGTISYVDIV